MAGQKVVLITGCSSGIGLKTAVTLAKDEKKRFKVYATMRSLEKKGPLEEEGKAFLGKSLFIEELDVTKEDSINKSVEKILAKEGIIDVLVNNAGVGRYGPAEFESNEVIDKIYNTNVFGPIKLTRKLLPLWKEKQSGHVLTVTSVGGLTGMAFTTTYCSAKFAMEGYFESLALELLPFENIKSTLIEPGPVVTSFVENAGIGGGLPKEVDEKTASVLEGVFKTTMAHFDGKWQQGEEVADVILEAITASKPHLRYSTNSAMDGLLKQKYTDLTGDSLINASIEMFKM